MKNQDPSRQPKARADLVLSVALPLAILALGAALSIGSTGGFEAFVALCLSVVQ